MEKKVITSKKAAVEPDNNTAKNLPIWYYLAGLFLLWILFHYKILFGIANIWEDMVNFEFPNRIFARNSLLSFQFPHWDPNTFSGMPFFASSHTAVFYPTNLLLSLLNVGKPVFWYLLQVSVLAHFLLAGINMFIYTLHARLSRPASFFAAIGYMFCGFAVTHSIHPMMLYIFTWLPVVILFLEKSFINTGKALTFSLIAGLVLGITTLAGHPQITFYEILFIGAYCIYLIMVTPGNKLRQIFNVSLCFIIAGAIASILYLPAAELSTNSVRTDWTFEQVSEGSFQIAQFITFIIPKAFGAWTGGDDKSVPAFWLQGPQFGYYTYWETCFYAGIGILLLAMIQFKLLKKDRFILFCLIWIVFSLLIAIGNNSFLFRFFFHYIPGFDKFRIPARILFTWNFIFPLLAARTFDSLRKNDAPGTFPKIFIITASIIILISVAVGTGIFKSMFPATVNNPGLLSFASQQAWLAFFNITTLTIVLYLRLRAKITFRTAAALLLVFLTFDLLSFGMNHHQRRVNIIQEVYGRNAELSDAIKKELSKSLFRVNSRQFAFNDTSSTMVQNPMRIVERNQGMIDNIQLLEGYNPYQLFRRLPPTRGIGQFQRMLDLLNVKYYIDPAAKEFNSSTIRLNSSMLPRARMFYNYEVFSSDSAVRDYMLSTNYDYKHKLLLSSKPSLTIQQSADSVQNEVIITRYKNNRIDLQVTTTKNGLLWMSEIWYPAWKAFVDKKKTPIHCADYSFRAVEIPEGTHQVTFVYKSEAFQIGLLIAVIAILSAAAYIILQNYNRKRKTA